jgi:hypothetical protein
MFTSEIATDLRNVILVQTALFGFFLWREFSLHLWDSLAGRWSRFRVKRSLQKRNRLRAKGAKYCVIDVRDLD